jgi:hypothetical protein
MEKVYFYSNSDQFYFDDEDDGAGYDDYDNYDNEGVTSQRICW